MEMKKLSWMWVGLLVIGCIGILSVSCVYAQGVSEVSASLKTNLYQAFLKQYPAATDVDLNLDDEESDSMFSFGFRSSSKSLSKLRGMLNGGVTQLAGTLGGGDVPYLWWGYDMDPLRRNVRFLDVDEDGIYDYIVDSDSGEVVAEITIEGRPISPGYDSHCDLDGNGIFDLNDYKLFREEPIDADRDGDIDSDDLNWFCYSCLRTVMTYPLDGGLEIKHYLDGLIGLSINEDWLLECASYVEGVYPELGGVIVKEHIYYNALGLPVLKVMKITYVDGTAPQCKVYKTELVREMFTYDTNGNLLTHMITHLVDGKLVRSRVESTIRMGNIVLTLVTENKYDENGQITRSIQEKTVSDQFGEVAYTRSDYDKGHLFRTEQRTTERDDQGKVSRIFTEVKEYDADGNIISTQTREEAWFTIYTRSCIVDSQEEWRIHTITEFYQYGDYWYRQTTTCAVNAQGTKARYTVRNEYPDGSSLQETDWEIDRDTGKCLYSSVTSSYDKDGNLTYKYSNVQEEQWIEIGGKYLLKHSRVFQRVESVWQGVWTVMNEYEEIRELDYDSEGNILHEFIAGHSWSIYVDPWWVQDTYYTYDAEGRLINVSTRRVTAQDANLSDITQLYSEEVSYTYGPDGSKQVFTYIVEENISQGAVYYVREVIKEEAYNPDGTYLYSLVEYDNGVLTYLEMGSSYLDGENTVQQLYREYFASDGITKFWYCSTEIADKDGKLLRREEYAGDGINTGYRIETREYYADGTLKRLERVGENFGYGGYLRKRLIQQGPYQGEDPFELFKLKTGFPESGAWPWIRFYGDVEFIEDFWYGQQSSSYFLQEFDEQGRLLHEKDTYTYSPYWDYYICYDGQEKYLSVDTLYYPWYWGGPVVNSSEKWFEYDSNGVLRHYKYENSNTGYWFSMDNRQSVEVTYGADGKPLEEHYMTSGNNGWYWGWEVSRIMIPTERVIPQNVANFINAVVNTFYDQSFMCNQNEILIKYNYDNDGKLQSVSINWTQTPPEYYGDHDAATSFFVCDIFVNQQTGEIERLVISSSDKILQEILNRLGLGNGLELRIQGQDKAVLLNGAAAEVALRLQALADQQAQGDLPEGVQLSGDLACDLNTTVEELN